MGYLIFVLVAVAIAVIVWIVGRNARRAAKQPAAARQAAVLQNIAVLGGAAAIVFGTISSAVHQIPAGNVGVVYQFGAIVGQVGEGLQVMLPWQSVTSATVQVQGHPFDRLDSFSRETQDVYFAATLNIRVSPDDIQNLYRNIGPNYFNILVRPRVEQAFKDETVKYRSVDIAPNREPIRQAVRERLSNELLRYSILVDDLLINNISFTAAFQQAINDKQIATQNALAEEERVAVARHRAEQVIETARGSAEAILITAQKQAEANAVLAASISPEYIQYLFASKLAPNVSVMMIPTGQDFILSPDFLTPRPAIGAAGTTLTGQR